MGMRTRLLAAAAAAVFASTGLAVMMPSSPALAAETSCKYRAVTNQSNYARAENYGYGSPGKCNRVQARAWVNFCGYSNWHTGPMHGTESQVSKGSNCSFSNKQTRAEPLQGHWTGYSTANGLRTVKVTH